MTMPESPVYEINPLLQEHNDRYLGFMPTGQDGRTHQVVAAEIAKLLALNNGDMSLVERWVKKSIGDSSPHIHSPVEPDVQATIYFTGAIALTIAALRDGIPPEDSMYLGEESDRLLQTGINLYNQPVAHTPEAV